MPDDILLSPLENRLASLAPLSPDADARAKALHHKAQLQADYIRRDQGGESPESLGAWWSDAADTMLAEGLEAAWRQPDMQRRTLKLDADAGVPGLFILGLGKLGGQDLNFSSDVDLVAFYDPDTVPIPAFEGKTHVCARVLRGLNKLLDGHKSGPFAWRIDWRLRPDPSVTDLAMSVPAGLDYFFFHSPPWRRLAMMKARVVAGDLAAGQAFLKELHPFIWRRSLDKQAIDEIAGLKQRIRADHAELESERLNLVPLDQAAGFHLKLGMGGIREIEFMVNALQLVWGGREPALQTAHTLTALRHLVAQGQLAAHLEQDYLTLRALENRVQYWADGHEHRLPQTADQQNWLAARSGAASWDALAEQVCAIRARVSRAFQAQFDGTGGLASTATQQTIQVIDCIEDSDYPELAAWQSGFRGYGLAPSAAAQLAPVGQIMAAWCLKSQDTPLAIKTLQGFLKSLGPSLGSYLRLFADQPALLQDVMGPLTRSEAMTILLEQSPHVIDGLISNGGQVPAAPDVETGRSMVAAAPNYERKLGALRAFVNEQLYLAYLTVLEDKRDAAWGQSFLTQLAETTLERAADILCGEYDLPALPFTVLAMGKLASRAMMPMSDLDLIFIVPDNDGSDFDRANKMARRFVSLLDAPMKEGRAYPTDTRLRPSGRSGPPTVSLSSFRRYQLNNAHTWEHLALVTARVVLDAPGLAQDIYAVRQEILRKPRDIKALEKDGAKMLWRLRKSRYTAQPAPGEIKLRPGGLMEAEYLLNYRVLRDGATHGDWPDLPLRNLPQAVLGSDLSSTMSALETAQFHARLIGTREVRSTTSAQDAAFDQFAALIDAEILTPSGLSPETMANHTDAPVLWGHKD